MTAKNSPVNPLMVELNVPRSLEVAERIHGFYGDIGWRTWDDSREEFTSYVSPVAASAPAPVLLYWQTTSEDKVEYFNPDEGPELSGYSAGVRLPKLQKLVEVCLVVPTDDDVHTIFERGGPLLEKHAHVVPRTHAGREEFRFADPFNYSLRVTANPGWEITPPKNKRFFDRSINLVGPDEFASHWGAGARLSWSKLLKIVAASQDCPMVIAKDGDAVYLSGDLAEGIDWLRARSGNAIPAFLTILEKVNQSRQAAEALKTKD